MKADIADYYNMHDLIGLLELEEELNREDWILLAWSCFYS